MVNTCVVFGCHSRSNAGNKISFYRVPSIISNQGEKTEELSSQRLNAWINRIGRKEWQPSEHSRVCSEHFISGKPSEPYNTNHPDWAPTVQMGSNLRKTTPATSIDRYARIMERETKRVRYSAAQSLLDLSVANEPRQMQADVHHFEDDMPKKRNICVFYWLGPLHNMDGKTQEESALEKVQQLTDDNFSRMTESIELKKKIQSKEITPQILDGKEEKVKYYTGLPGYISMMALFDFVAPYIIANKRNALTKFQMFFMTLTKLRHNTPMQDLAYQYDVSVSTISRTFNNCVNVMHVRMKDFIMWPEREQLRKTMPMEFRKSFGLKVAIIIDCFEIFIERPSNLSARAETWSHYKHSNTVKFLIGVTPQGSVSFLSSAWGGRTSDKNITENCGLLQKLLPGDVVLADRGFDIAESVGLMCAEVKIPAFTRGKKQLSPLEVESTKKIAHVRIHVERVIGLVRNKYTILKGRIPIDYLMSDAGGLPLIDKIATVCCALSNLCESTPVTHL